ncbi:MAG: DUF11 domain-containing protein, partial [Oscillospiraceae bacterium]|nr:DUF11 domain-containing protein [Oscillospiraceae bacterium]
MSYKLMNFRKGKRSARVSRTNIGNRLLAITMATLMMLSTIAAGFLDYATDYDEDFVYQGVVADSNDYQDEYSYDSSDGAETPFDADELYYDEDEYSYEDDYNNEAEEIELAYYNEYIDIEMLSIVNDEAGLRSAVEGATGTVIITIDNNITITGAPILVPSGVDVTLVGDFTITRPLGTGRHFIVGADTTLRLTNVTLCGVVGVSDLVGAPGNVNFGGGITVEGARSTLIMNGAATIQNSHTNLTTLSNTERAGGGVRFVGDRSTLIMNGTARIMNSEAREGGGVAMLGNNNRFIMNGAARIQGNQAGLLGGGVYIRGSGSETVINNGFVEYNEARSNSGGGLQVSGSFTMIGGGINNNTAATNGGGIRFYHAGTTFTMTGGEMRGNTARTYQGGAMHSSANGGSIYIGGEADIRNNQAIGTGVVANARGGGIHIGTNNNQTLTIGGNATIVNNTAAYSGGGVDFASEFGTFIMEGGFIGNNVAEQSIGGGIRLFNIGANPIRTYPLTFIMTGGVVHNNEALDEVNGNGGGIYVGPRTEVTINNVSGSIHENRAGNSGGGMFVASTDYSVGPVTIINGTITGNHAGTDDVENGVRDNGGGILLGNRRMDIRDATFRNNSAVEYGGGIWTLWYHNLTVSDRVVFGGNRANAPHDHGQGNRGSTVPVHRDNTGGGEGGSPEHILWATPLSLPGTHALNNYDINYTGTRFIGAPELQITKTATPDYGNTLETAVEVERGDTIVYSIEVENLGTAPALNIVVEDQIPAYLTINQAGIQGQFGTTGPLLTIAELEAEGVVVTVSGQLVTWTIEELAADTTFMLIIPTTVSSATPNSTIFRNQAIITEVDGEDTDYRSEVIYHEVDEEDEVYPDLSVTKTATPEYGDTLETAVEVERGDAIVYTIEVENSGTGPALNVVVEDQ